MLKLNCIESLTAIGIGVGACALAPLDAGLTAGAVIGGAGLFARIRENLRKPGLEEPDTIRRVQKEVLRDWDHWQNTQERRDAVTLADAAMTRWLPTVMLTREELAATATESGKDDERYPVIAARKIADRLGDHDPSFEAPEGEQPEPLARQFAREVIERALRAAKNDLDYATFLTLDIAIELGRAIAETFTQLKSVEQKMDAGFAAVLARLDNDTDIPLKAIREQIGRFIELDENASLDAIIARIDRFIPDYRALSHRIEALDAKDNRLKGAQQAAAKALDEGDLEAARRYLAEAAEVKQDRAAEYVQEAAAQFGELAAADLLALDWRAADGNWSRAEAMLAPFDRAGADALCWQATEKLLDHGTIFGARSALDAVIARARAMQTRLSDAADDKGFANWSIWLGNALCTQGQRTGGEAGLALLADAVAAYRAALTVYTESAMPADWAMTQNNLGTALQTQGARTGDEAGLALLTDAVAAYRAALTVYTESAMPADWAMTQNNLGNALSTQGERTGGKAGLALLAEAVAAYRAALAVYTESAMPADWAATQNNLGNALSTQGARTGGEAGLALLADAVAAYRAALTVYTESAMPAYWAMTQNNLGNALRIQGERTGGEAGLALLAEAVAAYRAALIVRTESAMPAKWAMTQENIALAFEVMADLRDDSLPNLSAAEAAVLAALRVYTPGHMSYYYGTATALLTRIRARIADRTN
ncbi:hypothetical protein [Sphingomonas sp. 28-62-20]|uniref:hypothetical protein n=1 Tax=Sphingomonas sp. 28-62-20 TaxID=1970433 RepID=UPI00267DD3CA